MKFFVDKSDDRNRIAGALLEKEGFEVFEFEEMESICPKVIGGDIIVFSPAKKFCDREADMFPSGIKIVAGNIEERLWEKLKQKQISHLNLLENEKFAIKNANLTAEGVLAIIIEKSRKSMFESRYMIFGGGRIAKALAILFSKLNLRFSIVTFNPKKYPDYFLYTDEVYFQNEFVEHLSEYDILINTIPTKFINNGILSKIEKGTLMIETASVDCLDREMVGNFEFIPAPALPKRYSPESAGKVVFETIMEGLNNGKQN